MTRAGAWAGLLLLATAAPAAAQEPWDSFPPEGATVARPGVPGTVTVFGPTAEAVLPSGDRNPVAVAAVATAGDGRLLAIAHNGYLAPSFYEDEDAFMARGLAWLRGKEEPGTAAFLGGGRPALAATLEGMGYTVRPFAVGELDTLDLLIVEGEGPQTEETVVAVQEWILGGGQVLAAICPWGWQQIHGGRGWLLSEDLAANQLLMPHGLLFTDGTAAPKQGGDYVMDRGVAQALSCQRLVRTLERRGRVLPPLAPLEAALRALPADDTILLPMLAEILPRLEEGTAPTPETPFRAKEQALERLAVVAMDRRLQESTAADAGLVAPGASSFPGALPRRAKPVSRTLTPDPAQAGWQSTGLYVAPGEPVTVTGAEAAAGWRYRIGAHADLIWHKGQWPRWPAISRHGALEESLFSPFGGLLYLEAVRGEAQPISLQVDGAYPAPHWKQGETDAAAWRRLRKAPGPWAELEGRYLIITLPSRAVRKLDDPQELMDWWDEVVRQQHAFAGETPPARPERFVSDVLISAGYMHAGYPIMMHLDVAEPRAGRPAVLVDLEELTTKGNWGMVHELGHNRQKPTWTFGGTGEVTNNIFSLHSGEHMSGIQAWDNPWLEDQKLKGIAYLKQGADFADWKRQPGIALLCYAQVAKAFGWEPFTAVFSRALELAPGQRPRDDQAKRDRWVRELSLATGHDLRAFHLKWGWPDSGALEDDPALDALPSWMPDFDELKSTR
jgi:hypothetical protein